MSFINNVVAFFFKCPWQNKKVSNMLVPICGCGESLSIKFKSLGAPGITETCALANVELFRTLEVSSIELLFRKA